MAVNLSPIWGAGAQLLDNSGNVLSGGKIYTYAAGTTTPAATYTASNGVTANSNPIILNSAGRVPYEIWLTDGVSYKFVLKDSNDTLIATYDNLNGINSNFIAYTAQQEIQTATAGQTVFNLTTMQYQPGTNNLAVYVDGVNQYGPGAQYAYVETDTDTVTFVFGLHVGASVKFTTASPVSSGSTSANNVSFTGVKGQTGAVSDLGTMDGSDWIGFQPDGTGAVSSDYSIQDKLRQTVSVKDFGAVGDGVTDDTVTIQNAIDAISVTGGTLLFPVGTYKCDSGLTLSASNVQLLGEAGAKLDFSSAPIGNTGLTISGTGATAITTTLTANVNEGDYSITVASATSFAVKDWVLLSAEDYYDYNGSTFVKRGEIKRILSIASNTIGFDNTVYESYTTANTAKITKLSLIENVSVDNLIFVGIGTETGNDLGIKASYVNNLVIQNCKFYGFEYYANYTLFCIHFSILNNYYEGVRYQSSAGALFYAVYLANCSQWGVVAQNIGRQVRHLVTTSSTQTAYGQPYFITVNANVMEDAQAGTSYASYAFEQHGFGRFVVWSNNVADSCYAGFNIELGDQIITNNYIRGCRVAGIIFGDATAGRNLKNIIISNNVIDLATSDGLATYYGVQFVSNPNSVRENIIISNNIFNNTDAASRPSSYGIRVLSGSGSAAGCVIRGNSFKNVLEASASDYCIRIEQDGWSIMNNTILDYERCIYIQAASAEKISIIGNKFALSAAPSTTYYAIEIRANNCIAMNNVFRGLYRAFYVDTGVTGAQILGNAQSDMTNNTVGDLGTGTVLAYAGGGF